MNDPIVTKNNHYGVEPGRKGQRMGSKTFFGKKWSVVVWDGNKFPSWVAADAIEKDTPNCTSVNPPPAATASGAGEGVGL